MSTVSAFLFAGVAFVLGAVYGWRACESWIRRDRPPVEDWL